jgi:hypothetical protein
MRIKALVLATALAGTLLPVSIDAVAQDAGCSWPTHLNQDTFNFAYPDESAAYWGAHLPYVTPETEVVIEGRYPNVRYFSFHVYDEVQRPIDSISDLAVRPSAGGNPFSDPKAGGGRYRVRVAFEAKPKRPRPNTIYAGAMENGMPNPGGFLIYRIYVPDDEDKPTGGVPLPTVILRTGGGAIEIPFGSCDPLPPDQGGQTNDVINDLSYPDQTGRNTHHPAATDPPVFRRFYGTDQFPKDFRDDDQGDSAEAQFKGGFLSNQQIAYLYAYVSREYGDVLVLRVRAPSFPDTRAGVKPTAPRDVRYWSVCQNNGLSQRVSDCTADYQSALRRGYATIVISDPSDRPKNATKRNGVTWLAWGGAYYEGLVIYRHMLPARNFDGAIQRIREGRSASKTIGSYYPSGAYCTKERFERGGWEACFGHD